MSGCAPSVLEGRASGLRDIIQQAQDRGAYACAPRELALALSHVAFAELEIAQGNATRSEEHITLAEPNARAALQLSSVGRCAVSDVDKDTDLETDTDEDGIVDIKDKCLEPTENFNSAEAETEARVEDECAQSQGVPENQDADGDRVKDADDVCIYAPEDLDGYQDEDGCPEPDNDLDGQKDSVDACPNIAEDLDGYQDEDGCPEPDNANKKE